MSDPKTLNDLIPDPDNARLHNDRNIGMIVDAIGEVGLSRSIVIDENDVILAGNGVTEAARKAGKSKVMVVDADGDTLVAVRRSGLSDEEKKRLALYDNRTGELAAWDFSALEAAREQDPEMIGEMFDGPEWDQLRVEAGIEKDVPDDPGAQVDRAEELRVKWNVNPGDLWQLGNHRVICGDCTDAAVVARVMGGEKADMVFTSPPYAAQREYKIGAFDWLELMLGMSEVVIDTTKEDGSILINLGLVHIEGRVYRYWDDWLDWMEDRGQPLYGWYVWDKLSGLMGDWRGRLAPAHEWIFHFAKRPRPANKTANTKYKESGVTHYKKDKVGLRSKDGSMSDFTSAGRPVNSTKVIDSVIRCQPQRGGVDGHPAPFSIEFASSLVEVYANIGMAVYDPFLGSGTTLIACERLSRRCRGVEISAGYVAVTLERWAQMTGKTPVLIDLPESGGVS